MKDMKTPKQDSTKATKGQLVHSAAIWIRQTVVTVYLSNKQLLPFAFLYASQG